MKALLAALLLLSSALYAQTPSFKVKTQARFSMANLFKEGIPVRYSDYGIPQSVAHDYVIQTTISVPKDLRVEAKVTSHPQSGSCPRGACNGSRPSEEGRLKLQSKEMKIITELFDGITGELVARIENPFVMEFSQYLPGGETIHFSSELFNINTNASFSNVYLHYLLQDKKTMLTIAYDFKRLTNSRFIFVKEEGNWYRLVDLKLDQQQLNQDINRGILVEKSSTNANVYLTAGASGESSPEVKEELIH